MPTVRYYNGKPFVKELFVSRTKYQDTNDAKHKVVEEGDKERKEF